MDHLYSQFLLELMNILELMLQEYLLDGDQLDMEQFFNVLQVQCRKCIQDQFLMMTVKNDTVLLIVVAIFLNKSFVLLVDRELLFVEGKKLQFCELELNWIVF